MRVIVTFPDAGPEDDVQVLVRDAIADFIRTRQSPGRYVDERYPAGNTAYSARFRESKLRNVQRRLALAEAANVDARATATTTVRGEEVAADVAQSLVHQSGWFEVMPMPDDRWEFTVRAEATKRLAAAVDLAQIDQSDCAAPVAVDAEDAVIGPDGDGTEVGWRVDRKNGEGLDMSELYANRADAQAAADEQNGISFCPDPYDFPPQETFTPFVMELRNGSFFQNAEADHGGARETAQRFASEQDVWDYVGAHPWLAAYGPMPLPLDNIVKFPGSPSRWSATAMVYTGPPHARVKRATAFRISRTGEMYELDRHNPTGWESIPGSIRDTPEQVAIFFGEYLARDK